MSDITKSPGFEEATKPPSAQQPQAREKQTLPMHSSPPSVAQKPKRLATISKVLIITLLLATSVYRTSLNFLAPVLDSPSSLFGDDGMCKQYPSLAPPPGVSDGAKDYIYSKEFRNLTIERLTGAVKIETQSYDDLGQVGEDERMDHFYKFASYLETSFPLLYSTVIVEKINTHGLLYTWKGSDESLKPLLFMAHQDTVPVNPDTIDQWDYPPWSGYYDGRFIHGRGSSDCKAQLIATLEGIQVLIQNNFVPQRTILISFGFDEEIGGFRGAKSLAEHITETYGTDSIEAILDEGGQGIQTFWGQKIALPGVGEKGATNVVLTLHTAGGHSSVPPPHTGIGLMSSLISALESSPPQPELIKSNPFWSVLQCGLQYGDMDKGLKKKIKEADKHNKAMIKLGKDLFEEDRATGFLWTTSQATDLIKGGVKVNALPEQVVATVNHRIRPGSSIQEVKDHYIKVLRPVAKKFKLSLDAFGDNLDTASKDAVGNLVLTTIGELDVAPLSPTDDNYSWKTFSGTIKHVYTNPGEDLLVSEGLMVANTDTRWYWDLTKNIYRFSPIKTAVFPGGNGVHTVNERVEVDQHIQGTWFIHELVRNFDEA